MASYELWHSLKKTHAAGLAEYLINPWMGFHENFEAIIRCASKSDELRDKVIQDTTGN